MNPPPAEEAPTLRYDAAQGVAWLRDLRRPLDAAPLALATFDDVLPILAARAHRPTVLAELAGYGLALVARQWQGRPSDARRAAVIQAAEQARSLHPSRVFGRLITEAAAQADAAIMDGSDVEQAVIAVTQAAMHQARRAAERCGRRAAELLDASDRVVIYGIADDALLAMLRAARFSNAVPQITLADTPERALAQRQFAALGLEIAPATSSAGATMLLAGALHTACDGSMVAPPGCAAWANQARQDGVPVYVLAADGPDPAVSTGADLPSAALFDILPPDLTSLIITDRGMYRPAMLVRYFNDGNAPLDVIPLQ